MKITAMSKKEVSIDTDFYNKKQIQLYSTYFPGDGGGGGMLPESPQRQCALQIMPSSACCLA